jgi:hypothetical protein
MAEGTDVMACEGVEEPQLLDDVVRLFHEARVRRGRFGGDPAGLFVRAAKAGAADGGEERLYLRLLLLSKEAGCDKGMGSHQSDVF